MKEQSCHNTSNSFAHTTSCSAMIDNRLFLFCFLQCMSDKNPAHAYIMYQLVIRAGQRAALTPTKSAILSRLTSS